MKNEILETPKYVEKIAIRQNILALESEMFKLPNALIGDAFPLKHTFADGCYIREMFAPKGHLIVTKIHKKTHPYFVLKGDCSVLTENGIKRIKAPFSGITPAGTKRVVYTHEDTIWITVHITNETDIDKIEEEVIAKNFDEIDNTIEINDFIVEAKKIEEGQCELKD